MADEPVFGPAGVRYELLVARGEGKICVHGFQFLGPQVLRLILVLLGSRG